MNYRNMTMMLCLSACAIAVGQGKEGFMQQQAYAEMQRVSGQVDVLHSNLSELQTRVSRLEGGGDTRGIRQEIDSLKAAIADIRRELQAQRGEIVQDISGRIAKIQRQVAPPAPVVEKKTVVVMGPHVEYTVKAGDTLSMIAEAFGTTVNQIKDMNGIKNSNNLRVGQKLNVPKK